MKKLIFFLVIVFAIQQVSAQTISAADRKILQKKEDSLKVHAKNMILDSLMQGKMRSDSHFVRTLIRSLQVRNSFYFPFDSVKGVSKLYAPDSSFRIFTWTLAYDDYYSRQRGAIQMRTRDGSLRLTPLYDFSEFTTAPNDSMRTKANWIGAVYYNIIKTQHNGKNYYTMFGIDNNSIQSNKKWIEVLTFNERNEPVFGGKMFTFQEDSVKRSPQDRYSLEYKEDARILVTYDPEMKMILFDHLVSESEEPEKPWTYIPDGDYEGFKWQNGKWVHIDKVFNFKLKDGEAPVDDPLMDEQGNKNEEKLKKSTDKNKGKTGGG